MSLFEAPLSERLASLPQWRCAAIQVHRNRQRIPLPHRYCGWHAVACAAPATRRFAALPSAFDRLARHRPRRRTWRGRPATAAEPGYRRATCPASGTERCRTTCRHDVGHIADSCWRPAGAPAEGPLLHKSAPRERSTLPMTIVHRFSYLPTYRLTLQLLEGF